MSAGGSGGVRGGAQWLQSWWKPFKTLSQGPASACSCSGHVAGSPVNPAPSTSCTHLCALIARVCVPGEHMCTHVCLNWTRVSLSSK